MKRAPHLTVRGPRQQPGCRTPDNLAGGSTAALPRRPGQNENKIAPSHGGPWRAHPSAIGTLYGISAISAPSSLFHRRTTDSSIISESFGG